MISKPLIWPICSRQTATVPPAISVSATIQIPGTGNLADVPDSELWDRLRATGDEVRAIQKEIVRQENYLTALRWRRGQILIEIKRRVGHGQFLAALAAKKVKSQRASEDIRIAEHFPTETDAGRVSVEKALDAIKKSDSSYGPFENCFATPEWLKKAIERDYGYPGLDVASSHGVHFGDRFYTPTEDGLKQDWVRDCGGKPAWCNCPYNLSVLGQWVNYAYEQSQRGCTVICLLPFWRNYPWFQLVQKHAEIRLPGASVIHDGFGPKKGKQCGNLPPREYESIVAIFRARAKRVLFKLARSLTARRLGQ